MGLSVIGCLDNMYVLKAPGDGTFQQWYVSA